jgi:hypothetical protein
MRVKNIRENAIEVATTALPALRTSGSGISIAAASNDLGVYRLLARYDSNVIEGYFQVHTN